MNLMFLMMIIELILKKIVATFALFGVNFWFFHDTILCLRVQIVFQICTHAVLDI